MKILLDGLVVLVKDWGIVLGILSFMLLGAGIVFWGFKLLLGENLGLAEYLSLSLGGGLLPLLLGLLPALLLNFVFKSALLAFFLPLAVCIGVLLLFTPKENGRPTPGAKFPLFALALVLILSLLVRLAFISGLILPPYFDSAAHYEIIQGLIANFRAFTLPNLDSLNGEYYHLGFHGLVAALGLVLQADAKDVMLVFGQILLTLIPLPLFFIIRQETKLDMPGLFAVLLAGWGWAMPAHTINWGKYPALASLLVFEFLFCTAYLLARFPPASLFPFNRLFSLPNPPTRAEKIKSVALLIIGLLGAGGAALIHTRVLVLIAIFLLAYLLAMGWRRLSKPARGLIFVFTIGILVALAINIRAKPSLALVFEPYTGSGAWMTPLICLLLPFALKTSPQAAFANILALVLALGCLFIPILDIFPPYDYQTLLDRPFVEMILFLPLALLGGLGYAGLLRAFRESAFLQRIPKNLAIGGLAVLLFGAIFANAIINYNFTPSACCQVFKETDAAAFDWMDKNLPGEATILIASSKLYVLESSPTVRFAGSDAGVWIRPLINRKTFALPYTTNFDAPSVRKKLCQRGVTHIYIGATGQSFAPSQIQARPAWYERALFLQQVQVYRVVCP